MIQRQLANSLFDAVHGVVAQYAWLWTVVICSSQVRSPAVPLSRSDPRQIVGTRTHTHTHVLLFTKQYKFVPAKGGQSINKNIYN